MPATKLEPKPARKPAAGTNGHAIVRTTITIPQNVHSLGVSLAKKERRSFSNFLATLIEADAAKEVEA